MQRKDPGPLHPVVPGPVPVLAALAARQTKIKIEKSCTCWSRSVRWTQSCQIGKEISQPGFGNSYKFNEWNDWREADRFLCRSNKDCQWIDDKLNCEDYELDFTPLAGWFGGDTISIRGECTCE